MYDFVNLVKTEKGNISASISGKVCKGGFSQVESKVVNGRPLLTFTLKTNSNIKAKYCYLIGQYSKDEEYSDICFIKVNLWDFTKVDLIKNSEEIILSGILTKQIYEKDGRKFENFVLSGNQFSSLKVISFEAKNIAKSNDFEDEGDYSDIPF